jgi:hypothetical protein
MYRSLALQVRGASKWYSKIWPWVPWNSDPRKTGLVRPSSNCKLQTWPLVREGTPHQQSRSYLKIIKKKKKNWLRVTDGFLTPRQTGCLTIGHNMTLTLTWPFLGLEWDRRIWSWVLWNLNPKITALVKPGNNWKYRHLFSSEGLPHISKLATVWQ